MMRLETAMQGQTTQLNNSYIATQCRKKNDMPKKEKKKRINNE